MAHIERDVLDPEITRFLYLQENIWWYKPADVVRIPGPANSPNQPKKPFDFIILHEGVLVGIEAKVCKTGCLPLSDLRDRHGRYCQLEELEAVNTAWGQGYYLVNFRHPEKVGKKKATPAINRCFLVMAEAIRDFIQDRTRESISLSWFEASSEELERLKDGKGNWYWKLW